MRMSSFGMRTFWIASLCAIVLLSMLGSAHAAINVITVDNTPLTSPGLDFNGNPQNTMGLALQAVDQGGDFNVTEVTPAAFRAMSTASLATFDLIAILNSPVRSDDGGGLGTNWHAAVGITGGGCVVLSSHDPVRFHMNQLPGSSIFGTGFSPGGPGVEPFGAPDLIRQAALFAGSGPQTGLLIFDDSPFFQGGSGWDNAFLNLPPVWGISNSVQDGGFGFMDGGYTSITLPGLLIYTGLTAARFGVNTIGSFGANTGDASFHDALATWNAAIFMPSEVVINSGISNVGGLCDNCNFLAAAGPDGLPITLVRECLCEPVEDPAVRTQGFWKRVCEKPHPSGEHENLPDYVDFVNATATFSDVVDEVALCEELHPSPKKDKCEQAEAQFTALLLNLASGLIAECNCVDATTVGEQADLIDGLLSNPARTREDCVLAQEIADQINNGTGLVACP